MYQGQCAFTGYAVARGRGMNTINVDGRNILTGTRKARSLYSLKVIARTKGYTKSSRAFHQKENTPVKMVSPTAATIQKQARGFQLIPAALIAETPKTRKHEVATKGQKVNLKSNISQKSSKTNFR